jgi:hypothetical protein
LLSLNNNELRIIKTINKKHGKEDIKMIETYYCPDCLEKLETVSG